ncbi:hypothetical protein D3C76_1782150 [compost metagenome]
MRFGVFYRAGLKTCRGEQHAFMSAQRSHFVVQYLNQLPLDYVTVFFALNQNDEFGARKGLEFRQHVDLVG